QITLIPTRGLGILDVRQGGLRLGWDSPVKEVVHPASMNLLARGGLGWLEGFNEWLCRCGLENIGQPGKDEIITNTGAKAEVELTLHGKIANIPASQVENLVATPQEFQLLYHFNFGRPLLEDGARLRAPVARVTPFNARAAEDVKTYDHF